jgi:hypothetical protein
MYVDIANKFIVKFIVPFEWSSVLLWSKMSSTFTALPHVINASLLLNRLCLMFKLIYNIVIENICSILAIVKKTPRVPVRSLDNKLYLRRWPFYHTGNINHGISAMLHKVVVALGDAKFMSVLWLVSRCVGAQCQDRCIL